MGCDSFWQSGAFQMIVFFGSGFVSYLLMRWFTQSVAKRSGFWSDVIPMLVAIVIAFLVMHLAWPDVNVPIFGKGN